MATFDSDSIDAPHSGLLISQEKDVSEDISDHDLKNAYIKAARIVACHGDLYLPIFERLEMELKNREKKNLALKRALDVAIKNG